MATGNIANTTGNTYIINNYPGGATGSLQYNNNGQFAGATSVTWAGNVNAMVINTTNYVVGNSFFNRIGSLYFKDSGLAGYPSGSINFKAVGRSSKPGFMISPWQNQSDTSPLAQNSGLGIWRSTQSTNSSFRTQTTINGNDLGPGVHGVYVADGALDFNPDYAVGNTVGLSYIILPATFNDGTDKRYVGQVGVNAYNTPGTPQWSLGWKQSNTTPTWANERAPGNRNIIWDSNNHVSINEANLVESFNVRGNIRIEPTGANSDSGILFPDGTFQSTAAGGGNGGVNVLVSDDGNILTSALRSLNFVGNGITASAISDGNIEISVNSYSGMNVSQGNTLVSNVTSLIFNGNGVAVSNAGGNNSSTVTITKGLTGILVNGEGYEILQSANAFNFVGNGVITTNVAGVATVNIPGGGIPGISIQDEGTNVVNVARTINFVGNGVTASNVNGIATVNVTSSGIDIKDEGLNVVTSAGAINFTGNGVTTTNIGGVATVDIPGRIAGIVVQEEGTNIIASANTINFVGSSVTASNAGGIATVTVTAGGSNTQVQFNDGNSFNGNAGLTFNKTNTTLTANNFVATSSANLGSVGNVKITGGSNGQVLTTDGSGNLSWGNTGSGNVTLPIANGTSNINIPVANGNITFGINGAANAVVFGNLGQVTAGNITTTGTGVSTITSNSDINLVTANSGAVNITGGLSTSGNVDFFGANVSLGELSNIYIPGGNSGQAIITDGNGTLSWGNAGGGGGNGVTVQNEGTNVVANANTINFVGNGVVASNVGGVATVTIDGAGNPASGPIYSVQWNYGDGTFGGGAGFKYDSPNANVWIGDGFNLANAYINGSLNVGTVIGNSYKENGRLKYFNDGGNSGYGFNWPDVAGDDYFVISHEPGHEMPSATAIVLPRIGDANINSTVLGVSINNDPGTLVTTGNEANWVPLINLTKQDLFLPNLSSASGNTVLVYDSGNGRVTYSSISNVQNGIAVQEEGTNVVASTTIVNFVGNGVTASNVGGVATVTIDGAGTPGGTDTQLQYNNNGVFGGIPNVTYSNGNLSLGNVANVKMAGGTNGYYLQTDGAGNLTWATGSNYSGNGTVAGSNTQIQFNDEGNFGAVAGFTFDKVSTVFTANNIVATSTANLGDVGNVTITGGSANYVLKTDGAGNLSWGAQTGIAVQEEGTNVVASANTINFVGSSVTASNVGGVATITIANSGISGFAIQDEGTNVLTSANTINFVGNGVVASNVGGVATITISGGGGGGNADPGGSNTQVQYNDNGIFGGNPGFTFDEANSLVTANNFVATSTANLGDVANVTILGGSANLVLTTDGAGNLSWSNGSAISNVAAGGANTQVQYNDDGILGGNPGFTFNELTSLVTANNLTVSSKSNLNSVSNVTILGGTNGYYLQTDGAGNLTWAPGSNYSGNGTVAGSNTQVQFNDQGNFGASAGFTFNKTSTTLTANNFVATSSADLGDVGNVTITGGTANFVLTTDGSGNLSWANVANGGIGNISAGGANTQVQYNDNGVLGGNPGMTFNEGTTTLTANNFVATSSANLGDVGNVTIAGGSANYVLITDGAGNLSWSNVGSTSISGIAVQEEGTNVVASANTINFVGNGVTASNVGGVATVTITSANAQPAGNLYEIQLNSGTGTFAASSNFYYTASNGMFLKNALNLVNPAEHYTYWSATDSGGPAFQLGVYTPSGSEAFELYGPTHTSIFTVLPSGNIHFWGDKGGQGYPNITANAGLAIGTDIRFVNDGNTNPADGHVGIYFADGTYQYTAAGAGSSGISIVQEEGVNVTTTGNTINFVGNGVTASNVGGVATITIDGSGTPGGADTQVQYNDNGVFGGNPGMTFNEGTTTLTANNFVATSSADLGSVGNVTITGGNNGYYLQTDGAGGLTWAPGSNYSGNGTVAGANTQIQFNDEGNFGAVAGFTFNKTTTVFTANNIVATSSADLGAVANVTITGGSANYVLITDGSGSLSWANLASGGAGNIKAAGANTQIQYNDDGVLGGNPAFTFNEGTTLITANNLTVSSVTRLGAVSNVHIDGGNANYVLTTNGSGNLSWTKPKIGVLVQDEGANVVAGAETINFVGNGVIASNVSGVATITIAGGGISGIAVQEEGTNVLATANTINFVGTGVTASNVGGVATITIDNGANSYYGGYYLHTQPTANTVWNVTHNLNRQYVTVEPVDANGNSYTGRYDFPIIHYINANALTMTWSSAIDGYAAVVGGGVSSAPIAIQDEGTNVLTETSVINFVGAGVTASNVGGVATITISGGGGGNGSPGGSDTQLQFNDAGLFGGMPTVTYSNIFGGSDRYLVISSNATTDAAVVYEYGDPGSVAVTGVASSEGNIFVTGFAGAGLSKIAIEPGANGNIIMSLASANSTIQMGAVENIEITGGSLGQVLTTTGDGNLYWSTSGGGGGGGGLPSYLRMYTGGAQQPITGGVNPYGWQPLLLDNSAMINSIGATDAANGLTLLPAGTYYFETIVPVTCTNSDSIQNVYTAIVVNTELNGITQLAYGPDTPADTLAKGGTMQLGDWQTGSVYGTGSFILSTPTYVSLAFAQYTDTSPGAIVNSDPWISTTGGGYASVVFKLWKIA